MHPGVFMNGCAGTYQVPADSGPREEREHRASSSPRPTPTRARPTSIRSTGADTVRLSPKQIQAEHFTAMSGIQLNDRPAAEGGRRVGFTNAGDWINFEPVSLKGIDSVKVRYTSGGAGGIVQFRLDAPDGPVVGTAELPVSGGWDTYAEVDRAAHPDRRRAAHALPRVRRPAGRRDGGPLRPRRADVRRPGDHGERRAVGHGERRPDDRADPARRRLHRRGRGPGGHRGHVRVGLRRRRDDRRGDEGRHAHLHDRRQAHGHVDRDRRDGPLALEQRRHRRVRAGGRLRGRRRVRGQLARTRPAGTRSCGATTSS